MKITVGSLNYRKRKTNRVGKINISTLLDIYFGILPNFPDVTKLRLSRGKATNL